MTLFRGEKIYDDSNFHELIGRDGVIEAGGERRLLSALPRPAGHSAAGYSRPFSSVYKTFPRSEWSARIEEQARLECRVSDQCDFAPLNQGSFPTCWAEGPVGAMATLRRMMGLPYRQISSMSIAVPISGGNSGGWEGDAIKFAHQDGAASVDVWPARNNSRKYLNDPAVLADRKRHVALEWLEMETFDDWVTACLLPLPGAFAYNWMSHVMQSSDVVEIESGSFGFRPRNSWGDWGAKNKYGFAGYAVYREGKGTPSSGFVLNSITSSL